MNSQKLENLLNLALDSSAEERGKTGRIQEASFPRCTEK